jgi:hypothetical protein
LFCVCNCTGRDESPMGECRLRHGKRFPERTSAAVFSKKNKDFLEIPTFLLRKPVEQREQSTFLFCCFLCQLERQKIRGATDDIIERKKLTLLRQRFPGVKMTSLEGKERFLELLVVESRRNFKKSVQNTCWQGGA